MILDPTAMTSRSRALALALLDLMRAIREEVVTVDLARWTAHDLAPHARARAGELMRGTTRRSAREVLNARKETGLRAVMANPMINEVGQ